MRGKRMAEHVRMDMNADALPQAPGADTQLHRPNRQGSPALAHKERLLAGRVHAGFDPPCALFQPPMQSFHALAADGNDSGFVPLAEHSHSSILQIEIRHAQTDEFGQSKSRRIKKLHDGLIAGGQGIVDAKGQEPAHLIDVQGGRQPLLRFGRAHIERWIAIAMALAHQEFVKRPHRRQTPLNASRAQAPAMQRGGKAPQLNIIERLPRAEIALFAVLRQRQ
jgi:hypothetical protein